MGRLLNAPESVRSIYALLLAVKFAVILGVISLLIYGLGIDGLGLVVGYSTMILALLVGAVRYAGLQDADGSQDEG